MSYAGTKVSLPLGKFGVRTDDPNQELAPGELFRAVNVDFSKGMLQKAPGTRKINFLAQLPSKVINAIDWSPTDGVNYIIAACANGKLYRFTNWQTWSVLNPLTDSTPTLTMDEQTHFVATEPTMSNGSPTRKLIFFSGNNLPQVIDGNASYRRDITSPATDWLNGDSPTFGLVYAGRLYTLSKRHPHQILISRAAVGSQSEDFEMFTAPTDTLDPNTIAYMNIFPGEGENLTTLFVFRGILFALKYPTGFYQINLDGTFARIGSSFGGISAHATCETMDDLLVGNQWGSITSIAAAFTLGNVKFADVFGTLRCEEMIRQETDPMFPNARWMLYHGDKKQAYMIYRSGSVNKLVQIDFNNQKAKASLMDFVSPNFLFMLRDEHRVYRPAFGAGSDGYIYMMDCPHSQTGFWHTDVGYAGVDYKFEAVTPYTDFGQDTHKIFDAIEIESENTGKWSLKCDVFVDDRMIETLSFIQSSGNVLSTSTDTSCFILDQDRLVGKNTNSVRRYTSGRGRNISLRLYEDGNTPAASFRVTKITIYVRIGNEDKLTQ